MALTAQIACAGGALQERPTGDHEQCLLDWAKIRPVGLDSGWRCDRDWVCEPCYDEYFVRDRLGLRC